MDVQILFGAEEIKQIYEKTLTTKKLDIICLTSRYSEVIGDYFDKKYTPQLFGSKIVTREILPDNTENRSDAKNKNGVKNQVCFIKIIKPSESDLLLFDDKVVLISYNQKAPFALVISDQALVTNLENQFEGLWKGIR